MSMRWVPVIMMDKIVNLEVTLKLVDIKFYTKGTHYTISFWLMSYEYSRGSFSTHGMGRGMGRGMVCATLGLIDMGSEEHVVARGRDILGLAGARVMSFLAATLIVSISDDLRDLKDDWGLGLREL